MRQNTLRKFIQTAAAGLAAAVLLSGCASGPKPEDTVKAWMDAAIAGDTEAFNNATTSDFREQFTAADIAAIDTATPITGYELGEPTINEEKTQATIVVTYNDGSSDQSVQLELHTEPDGNWAVHKNIGLLRVTTDPGRGLQVDVGGTALPDDKSSLVVLPFRTYTVSGHYPDSQPYEYRGGTWFATPGANHEAGTIEPATGKLNTLGYDQQVTEKFAHYWDTCLDAYWDPKALSGGDRWYPAGCALQPAENNQSALTAFLRLDLESAPSEYMKNLVPPTAKITDFAEDGTVKFLLTGGTIDRYVVEDKDDRNSGYIWETAALPDVVVTGKILDNGTLQLDE